MSVTAPSLVYSMKTVETVALRSNQPTERVTFYLKGNEHISFLEFFRTVGTALGEKTYNVKVETHDSSKTYKQGSSCFMNNVCLVNYIITLASRS